MVPTARVEQIGRFQPDGAVNKEVTPGGPRVVKAWARCS